MKDEDPDEQYLTLQENLEPLANPEFYIKNISLDLKISDWKLQFDSLNFLRRILHFHIELIYDQDFSVRTLVKLVATWIYLFIKII